MSPAERIISKFNGVRPLARALGHENPSTVQGWKERGLIPVRYAREIIEASAALNCPVVPSDFLPDPAPNAGSSDVDGKCTPFANGTVAA